jgi:hypothetical protein
MSLSRLKFCAKKKLSENLKEFLEKGEDWERKATSVQGIFLLKLLPYRSSPSQLVVEINPTDASGNPTKKRGLILRNSTELKEFRRLVNEAKLEALMSAVERTNPPARKTAGAGSKEEAVEI